MCVLRALPTLRWPWRKTTETTACVLCTRLDSRQRLSVTSDLLRRYNAPARWQGLQVARHEKLTAQRHHTPAQAVLQASSQEVACANHVLLRVDGFWPQCGNAAPNQVTLQATVGLATTHKKCDQGDTLQRPHGDQRCVQVCPVATTTKERETEQIAEKRGAY